MTEGVGERGKREKKKKFAERREKGSTSENIKREEITQKKDYKCSGVYKGLLDISKLYGHTGMHGSTVGCFIVQHLQLRDSNMHPPGSLYT